VKRAAVAQRGFSIVELMVAMAISLVLFAGALTIYLTSKGTYVDNERLARLQETGRIALDLIERDLRSTGVHVCNRLPPVPDEMSNRLASPDSMAWDFTRPIVGYDGDASTWATGGGPAFDAAFVPAALPGSDVLVLRVPARVGPTLRLRTRPASFTAALEIAAPGAGEEPVAGDIMAITDCDRIAYFQVSAYDANTRTIEHAQGAASGVPGNVDDSLEFEFNVGPQATSHLLPLQTVAYYLRTGADGTPALWRRVGRAPPEELLPGVERLQLMYGEDDDLDLAVDEYRNARDVRDWRNVVSVRVALLIRTPAEDGALPDSRTYTLLDADEYDPDDERLQRVVYTTTVSIRNRAG
jgi:type IV pilus assembly protein PilW